MLLHLDRYQVFRNVVLNRVYFFFLALYQVQIVLSDAVVLLFHFLKRLVMFAQEIVDVGVLALLDLVYFYLESQLQVIRQLFQLLFLLVFCVGQLAPEVFDVFV